MRQAPKCTATIAEGSTLSRDEWPLGAGGDHAGQLVISGDSRVDPLERATLRYTRKARPGLDVGLRGSSHVASAVQLLGQCNLRSAYGLTTGADTCPDVTITFTPAT
jgi:hypothetical protein